MKLFGYAFIAIAAAILVFAVVYGVMGVGRNDAVPTSEEEFLEAVRARVEQNAKTTGAVEATVPQPNQDFPEPRIEVETNLYDMGVIANDVKTEAKMRVYNRGTAPLHIKRVTTSCGCTKGRMTDDVIRPGKSADLLITVDPFRIPGFTSKKMLTIFSNDPENAQVQVIVTAVVEQEIEITPPNVNFGVIDKGEGAEQKIRIRQLLDKPFEISEATVTAHPQVFELEWSEVPEAQWRTAGRREYDLTAKVKPDAPVGVHPSRIMINTNLVRLKKAFVSLNVNVKGAYTLNPPFVALRSVKPGEFVKDALNITADVPIEVLSFEAPNENLEVTQRTTDGGVAFDVRISESSDATLYRDNWIVTIKVGDEEFREEVRVVAVVRSDSKSGAQKLSTSPAVSPGTRELRDKIRAGLDAGGAPRKPGAGQ